MLRIVPDGTKFTETDETLTLTVEVEGTDISHLQVDHSLENILTEFIVYPSEENVWGSQESASLSAQIGITASYSNLVWTINFEKDGATYEELADGVSFYLIVYDNQENASGSISDDTYFTITYTPDNGTGGTEEPDPEEPDLDDEDKPYYTKFPISSKLALLKSTGSNPVSYLIGKVNEEILRAADMGMFSVSLVFKEKYTDLVKVKALYEAKGFNVRLVRRVRNVDEKILKLDWAVVHLTNR